MQKTSSLVSMPGPAIGVAWGFSYGIDTPPEIFLPQLKKMNVNLTKLYLSWHQIEPKKSSYNWSAVDAFLDQLTPYDEALISIFSISEWATTIASTIIPASPAKSEDDYYHFIFALVKHCRGKVKLWQNDSEPNNPIYWNGTTDDFIRQLRIFYRAVKDANPDAKVVLGGYDGFFNPPGMPEIPGQEVGLSFFSKIIKEASGCFDIFDIRLYADPYTIPGRIEYITKMLAVSANDQPIICTEYNGPGFYEFSVNFKYINLVIDWQKAVASHNAAALQKTNNPIPAMYEGINNLARETQMFMIDCSKELNDKYDRLQSRDIVIRNVLAFSAGVQKTMYWCLTDKILDKYDLMTLMFGKNKLVDFNEGKVIKEYPTSDVFTRMTGFFNHMKTVTRIDVAGNINLHYFKITKTDANIVYVVWEKRDAFSGEDQLPTNYLLP